MLPPGRTGKTIIEEIRLPSSAYEGSRSTWFVLTRLTYLWYQSLNPFISNETLVVSILRKEALQFCLNLEESHEWDGNAAQFHISGL